MFSLLYKLIDRKKIQRFFLNNGVNQLYIKKSNLLLKTMIAYADLV